MYDLSERLRMSARSAVIHCVDMLDTLWRREPTVFIELGVAWNVGMWGVTLLLFGTVGYPPIIATSLGRLPEAGLGIAALIIATGQIGSIAAKHRMARGYASFAAAVWLGYLSFTIMAADYRLAGGYVYLGTAVAALLPFWRVVLDRRL